MSDYGTMLERTKYELPRATTNDETRITLEMISAIEHYKSHPFSFNTAEVEFTTTAGEQAYGNITAEGASAGYPDNTVGISTLYCQVGGSVWVPVSSVSFDELRLDFTSTSHQSYADTWAWYAKQIYLDPIPHTAYQVRIDYIYDIGIPQATYSGAAWAFTEEDGTTTLAGSYTNAWFTEAEQLIRARVKKMLHVNWYKDYRAADKLELYEKEQYSRLKSENEAMKGRKYIAPYQ